MKCARGFKTVSQNLAYSDSRYFDDAAVANKIDFGFQHICPSSMQAEISSGAASEFHIEIRISYSSMTGYHLFESEFN